MGAMVDMEIIPFVSMASDPFFMILTITCSIRTGSMVTVPADGDKCVSKVIFLEEHNDSKKRNLLFMKSLSRTLSNCGSGIFITSVNDDINRLSPKQRSDETESICEISLISDASICNVLPTSQRISQAVFREDVTPAIELLTS